MIDLTAEDPVVVPASPWGVLRDELRAVRDVVDELAAIERLRAERAVVESALLAARAALTIDAVGLRFEGPAHHGALAELRRRIEEMAADGTAIDRPPFEDSLGVERDLVRILLRAYNAEASLLVRTVTAAELTASVVQLRSAFDTLNRLAASMGLRISTEYHRLRIEELQLTAHARDEVVDDATRARADDLRTLSELGAVKRRLVIEQGHYELARRDADPVAAAAAATKLTELAQSLRSVTQRATEIRARLSRSEPASDEDSFPLQLARRVVPPPSPERGRSRAGWLGFRRS